MIYLIGGPPRVGKTHLVKHLVQQRPMHAVSTDAIRYMLRRAVPSGALPPDIFINFHEDVMGSWAMQSAEQTLEEQNRQSRAYWPHLQKFLESYEEDGVDVILEGVAILPQFTYKLELPHKSIFLGNTSDSHPIVITKQARQNRHDWMHGYTDDEIKSATEFFAVMSRFMREEAARYNLIYQELDDDNFEASLQTTAAKLLQ